MNLALNTDLLMPAAVSAFLTIVCVGAALAGVAWYVTADEPERKDNDQ